MLFGCELLALVTNAVDDYDDGDADDADDDDVQATIKFRYVVKRRA